MKIQYNIIIRFFLSLILSFSLIGGVISLITVIDPSFTISLIDLLGQINITAWLLLILCIGITFVLLAKIPVFAGQGKAEPGTKQAESEQSD